MTSRAERKALANQKREEYLQQIVGHMKNTLEYANKRFNNSKAAFEQALYSGDVKLNELLREHPEDAHLIRSACYQLRGRLAKSLGLKVKHG